MTDIIFSVSGDTANGEAEETTLSNEIIASGIVVPATGLLNLQKIDRLGDVLTITHVPGLSASDSGVLVNVIAAHSGLAVADMFAPGPTGDVVAQSIDEHAAISGAHHIRYTDVEAIAASSGALDHHLRYTDAEASGIAVQVTTSGIEEAITNHTAVVDAHHARYTDAEAIAASSGALDHHLRYTDAEASGVAVQVVTSGVEEAITNHTAVTDAHHTRYTDTEAIAASSGALDHHVRYTDAEASGIAVQVATSGIEEAITNHTAVVDAHHTRYTDAEASGVAVQVATTGIEEAMTNHIAVVDAHHVRYTDAEASGVAVQVATSGIEEAITNHIAVIDAHHTRYTDAEAIAASSGALDHHVRYTDAEASGVAVQVATSGIEEAMDNHIAVVDAHHARYTNAEASGIAVQVTTSGIEEAITNHTAVVDAHHTRYTDAEAIAAATGNVTLQTAYDAGPTVPQVILGADTLTIRDNATPLTSVFDIQNNAGTIDLLRVAGPVGGTQVELGAHDSLISGSNEPIIRIGDQASSMEFYPTDRTFTSTPGSLMLFDGTYEHNYANVSFAALNLQATIENRQSAFAFNHFLLFNNGLTIKNVNGVAANFGPGQTFIAQQTMRADGASITMSQNRDFLSQPRFDVINAGALSVTTWTQVQLFGQINTGVTMGTRNAIQIGALLGAGGTLTTERGIRLENLNRGATIIGFDSALTGTGKTFINHPGTSPSNFGGEIFMANTIPLTLGTAAGDRVSLSRPSAGVMRMIGAGGSFNEGLDWDFQNSNNVAVTSSTSAGLNFDLTEIAFGPSTVADGTNNWVFAFSPGLRGTQLAGDYSEVLFSSSSAISVAHAISNFATWTVNAPTISIGGGSITNAANVLIQTNMAQGTNRYGLLITSNPTGGTLNYAMRVTAGDSRFDGDLEHTGTNLGVYGTTPVAQSGDPGALTDNTGGTANSILAAVSGTSDDATINDNFADLTAKYNTLRDILRGIGITA